jgi:hypothetical protein
VNELQKTKKRDRKSVADTQHIDLGDIPTTILAELIGYTKKTEIPIFEEFCAELGVIPEFIINIDNDSIRTAIKILENKKKATLERKIYDAQLNATIGANLLKSWREESGKPTPLTIHQIANGHQLREAGLSEEEIDFYYEINDKIFPR